MVVVIKFINKLNISTLEAIYNSKSPINVNTTFNEDVQSFTYRLEKVGNVFKVIDSRSGNNYTIEGSQDNNDFQLSIIQSVENITELVKSNNVNLYDIYFELYSKKGMQQAQIKLDKTNLTYEVSVDIILPKYLKWLSGMFAKGSVGTL